MHTFFTLRKWSLSYEEKRMKASEDIDNKQLRNVSVSGLRVFSSVVKKAEGDWLGPILS